MTTIRIRVKGSVTDGRRAMAARGISGEHVGTGARGDETLFDVPEAQRPVLVAWYCEPAVCSEGRGFPVGTLLYHS